MFPSKRPFNKHDNIAKAYLFTLRILYSLQIYAETVNIVLKHY